MELHTKYLLVSDEDEDFSFDMKQVSPPELGHFFYPRDIIWTILVKAYKIRWNYILNIKRMGRQGFKEENFLTFFT